ncbi:MAG: hypothetical protein J5585_06910 [Clostridia bacterium]|nr:hypothetical protein [Clostridia bacterium]
MNALHVKLFAALGVTAIAGGIAYYAIKQTSKINPEMVGQVSTVAIDAVGELAGTCINAL